MRNTHIVGKGECLSSIAKKYRFTKWQTIYQHPDNAAFRKKRSNPNIICAGDELVIPARDFKQYDCGTDQKHKFVLKRQKTLLSIVVQDASGEPLEGKQYKLIIKGQAQPYEGTCAHGGLIEVYIEADATEGTLHVFACGGGYTWPLDVGNLDPVEEQSGLIARLQNLAYDISYNATPDEVADILKSFQVDHQLSPSGQLDRDTRDKLVALHDETKPKR